MSIEQYIVRELKQDIKYLIKKVADLEQKLEEAHPTKKSYTLSHDASGDVYTESKRMQDELEPIDDPFERNKAYIEHRKEFPYYPDKPKEDEGTKKGRETAEYLKSLGYMGGKKDDTFKRYESYREWDKTHDNYKMIYSPTNTDEHGKTMKDD